MIYSFTSVTGELAIAIVEASSPQAGRVIVQAMGIKGGFVYCEYPPGSEPPEELRGRKLVGPGIAEFLGWSKGRLSP